MKRTGADTMLKNAARDDAEFAWVPSGDSCAFCITLASRGWQRASKAAIKGGHAEHIHSNCDCTYAIRFDGKSGVAGYDPDKYLRMYEGAEGDTWQEKVNSMRRERYAENREKINEQKRAAYAKRKGLTGSENNDKLKINSPVESRNPAIGKPAAITHFDVELNKRQQRLLESLTEFGSSTTVAKSEVSMKDLAALTAKTGVEFALFTRKGKRLIVRGNTSQVNITEDEAVKMAKSGYRWSGHTHPGVGFNCLQASQGDMRILQCFNQKRSSILNSTGQSYVFWSE